MKLIYHTFFITEMKKGDKFFLDWNAYFLLSISIIETFLYTFVVRDIAMEKKKKVLFFFLCFLAFLKFG